MNVKFVEYDKRFLPLSMKWLNDPEIKKLTLTPDFNEESQLQWFSQLKSRQDYYIRGIILDNKLIGAVGIKHIDKKNGVGEYWGYIGEKEYIGYGIGKQMVSSMFKVAEKMSLKSLVLHVAKYNERAYLLYLRMGFILVNSDDMVYCMRKDL